MGEIRSFSSLLHSLFFHITEHKYFGGKPGGAGRNCFLKWQDATSFIFGDHTVKPGRQQFLISTRWDPGPGSAATQKCPSQDAVFIREELYALSIICRCGLLTS